MVHVWTTTDSAAAMLALPSFMLLNVLLGDWTRRLVVLSSPSHRSQDFAVVMLYLDLRFLVWFRRVCCRLARLVNLTVVGRQTGRQCIAVKLLEVVQSGIVSNSSETRRDHHFCVPGWTLLCSWSETCALRSHYDKN